VDGTHDHAHEIVYRDEFAIAFLNRFPTVLGYTLVAPIQHRVAVIDDFTVAEYCRLQEVIHRVGQALEQAVATERLYVLSLGSNQGNAHVHWHLAPLPPGVPYERQQLRAIDSPNGFLDIPPADLARLARQISEAIPPG
jgi:diadenosine tetraphosphate (Ap4A) HIT family hydrolase